MRFTGIVTRKYIDRENHMLRVVEINGNKTVSFAAMYDLWNELNMGDRISKEGDTLEFFVSSNEGEGFKFIYGNECNSEFSRFVRE